MLNNQELASRIGQHIFGRVVFYSQRCIPMSTFCVSCWSETKPSGATCRHCQEKKPEVGWLPYNPRGQRLDRGRYELLDPIGFGGFGFVARARQWCGKVSLGTVAIKFPHPEVADQVDSRAFIAEAEAIRKVQHPGIVVLHDAFLDGGIPYLVMELVESFTPLASSLPPKQTLLWIAVQAADAVDDINRKGVVHCDLKPDNIATRMWLSDFRPFVKVLDFGLASVWRKGSGYAGGGGTPGFAPPDQLLGDISPKCDVFALGAILYWMFAGELPYNPRYFFSPRKFLKAPPPPSLKGVPPELDSLIQSCLSLDPDKRYPRMPTAPLLDILKADSSDMSGANVDPKALLRRAKDTFIEAGLSTGGKRVKLYRRSAELFDELESMGKLPQAFIDKARKARDYANQHTGLFGRLFGGGQ